VLGATVLLVQKYFTTHIFFMTIEELQQTVDNWIKTIGIRYYNELTNTAILMEEVGEVARLMARIYGEQSFKSKEKALTAKTDLADEMADVLFVLVCLANQTGVDLTTALQQNLEKKAIRDAERHANNEKLK
jgi:NTP pyrophosphatase (non-canonical NTP hydrolase)